MHTLQNHFHHVSMQTNNNIHGNQSWKHTYTYLKNKLAVLTMINNTIYHTFSPLSYKNNFAYICQIILSKLFKRNKSTNHSMQIKVRLQTKITQT